jgi:hypothetical protein
MNSIGKGPGTDETDRDWECVQPRRKRCLELVDARDECEENQFKINTAGEGKVGQGNPYHDNAPASSRGGGGGGGELRATGGRKTARLLWLLRSSSSAVQVVRCFWWLVRLSPRWGAGLQEEAPSLSTREVLEAAHGPNGTKYSTCSWVVKLEVQGFCIWAAEANATNLICQPGRPLPRAAQPPGVGRPGWPRLQVSFIYFFYIFFFYSILINAQISEICSNFEIRLDLKFVQFSKMFKFWKK